MRRADVLDKKLDALLAGGEPAAGDELAAELAVLIEGLDAAFPPAVVSEQVEDLHIARMMQPATQSAAPAAASVAGARTPLLDRMRAGASRRVAAASLAFTATFGGAAYAGVLPAPVQRAVANAAGAVGLELPKPGDDDKKDSSVADDPQDRDDLDASEASDGRAEDGRGPDERAGDRGSARSRGGSDDDRRGSRGEDSAGDRRDGDARDDDDDDDDNGDDDGDSDDSILERRDDRSRAGGGGLDSDDDDDGDYEAPDTSDDSDSDDEAIERDDDDDDDSSFDNSGRDSSDDDELDVEADDVEDAADD